MLDYGYRSACCYGTIRLGRRTIKGTLRKINIWVCNTCGKRDVALVKYTGKEGPQSSPFNPKTDSFAPESEDQFQDTNDPRFES